MADDAFDLGYLFSCLHVKYLTATAPNKTLENIIEKEERCARTLLIEEVQRVISEKIRGVFPAADLKKFFALASVAKLVPAAGFQAGLGEGSFEDRFCQITACPRAARAAIRRNQVMAFKMSAPTLFGGSPDFGKLYGAITSAAKKRAFAGNESGETHVWVELDTILPLVNLYHEFLRSIATADLRIISGKTTSI